MNINYTFVDGTTTEIEVDDKWANIVHEMERQEYNSNRRETRRHESLYKTNRYEDNDEFCNDPYPAETDTESEVIMRENNAELNEKLRQLAKAIEQLTPSQQDLVKKVILGDMSVSDYAEDQGVSQPAISGRKERVVNSLKKFFQI